MGEGRALARCCLARCWLQMAGLEADASAIRADGRHLRGCRPPTQSPAYLVALGRTHLLTARCKGAAHSSSCTPRLVYLRCDVRTNPEGRVSQNASPRLSGA